MNLTEATTLDGAAARRVIAAHVWTRIVSVGEGGLRATYGPCLLEPDGPDGEIVVLGHFARADPQCADVEAGAELLLIFDGPWGYISASWYAPDVVDSPGTMDHVSVHLRGHAEPLTADERFALLERTSARMEAALGEHAWELQGEGRVAALGMAPQTVAFRLRAEHVEAKAKLSQNMPRPVVERVVERLNRPGPLANPALADAIGEHVLR